uniref:Uncharacterized protein n=1 Tax=Onchocerca volvulus TaxID=6282 RepID=A0A8R1XTJ0_ONCVO
MIYTTKQLLATYEMTPKTRAMMINDMIDAIII